MKSNAAGQLLGYSIQIPRALYYLLISKPDDIVCIEVLGDVARTASNSEVTAEEDKSSINGNPLTDRSTDLWKTFSNWVEAIINGELFIEKTRFILYTNQTGRSSIVNKLSSAKDKQEVQKSIDEAKEILKDIKEGHEIWEFYNYVIFENENLFKEVIERFELQIGKEASYDEVRNELIRQHFPISQIEFLLENICGWLQKQILEKISRKQSAIIYWEEFDHQFKVLFERARRLELIDFTLQNPLNDSEIQQQVKIRPCYLRQLEVIDTADDDIIEAVTDFLKAKVNRDKWIESEIIDVDVAFDFESRLYQFWKNQKDRIKITEKGLSETEQGKLLYLDCSSRQETIRGVSPPVSTVIGTYHALADGPTLGWHPNWENLFPKKKEN